MSAGITDYYINTMLNTLRGSATVALSTTQPVLAMTGLIGATNITEPSSSAGYARQNLAASDWNAAANRILSTNVDITFPSATADWGEVGWVVVYSGTRVVFFGELARKVNVVNGGDQVTIPAGTLSLYLPA